VTQAVRSRIATVVWLLAVVCALFLAMGALFVALKVDQDNAVVGFVLDVAARLDGPLGVDPGPFAISTALAGTRSVLLGWGAAAVAYLVIGKVIESLIRL
jgi:hypothetical protein